LAFRPRDPLLVPVTETPELPESVKRNGALFEIVFVFLLLPVIVATMDRPPFHVGGKILLWLGLWFLIRRLPVDSRDRVLAAIRVLRKPLILIAFLAALGASGALLAQFSGLSRFLALPTSVRWVSGAILLPAFAVVASLPLAVLAWVYVPVRFERSNWFGARFRNALPVLGFAGIHLVTFGWAAPGFALVAGSVYWWAFKGRVPLIPAILVHAVVGWMGIVGGVW